MKCFYHVDHDGHCAAYWVHKRFDKAMDVHKDFIEIDYGYNFKTDVLDKVQREEPVIIVDFSFDPDEMTSLISMVGEKNITWIDHHKSAIEKYSNFNTEIAGIRYDGISGAMLTYIYYFVPEYKENPDKVEDYCIKAPWMTKYVSDYDVWKYEYGDETTYFILGLDAENTNIDSSIWDILVDDHEAVERLIQDGTIIKKYKDRFNTTCLPRGFEFNLDGHKIFCMNNIRGNSTNFMNLIDKYDACLQYYYDGKLWNYSLYSTKIDCTTVKICDTQFAGHKGASGAESKLLFTDLENGVR